MMTTLTDIRVTMQQPLITEALLSGSRSWQDLPGDGRDRLWVGYLMLTAD